MKSHKKSTQVIEPKVKATIFGHGRGWVFTPREFLGMGDPRSVSMALTRLARKGLIRQLTRGLYDYPKKDPQIGVLSPSTDAVARALHLWTRCEMKGCPWGPERMAALRAAIRPGLQGLLEDELCPDGN